MTEEEEQQQQVRLGEIITELSELGLPPSQVGFMSRRSLFDGHPSPNYKIPPRKDSAEWKLYVGDIVMVSKYKPFHDVLVVIDKEYRDTGDDMMYRGRIIDGECPPREIEQFMRRDGVTLICRADDIDNIDLPDYVKKYAEGLRSAEELRQKQIRMVNLCTEATGIIPTDVWSKL